MPSALAQGWRSTGSLVGYQWGHLHPYLGCWYPWHVTHSQPWSDSSWILQWISEVVLG